VTGGDLPALMPGLSMLAMALVRIVPSSTRIMAAVASLRFSGPALASLLKEYGEAKRAADDAHLAAGGDLRFDQTLELRNVRCFYEGADTAAVCGVSMTIRRGQMVALAGPSGAGKSTLANLILGLLAPTSGHILADGRDIHRHAGAWRKHTGYIPQDIYLMDDTIRRNVALGIPDHEIDDAAVWRALEAAQLADFVRSTPEGLDCPAGDRGCLLSAGQRQRTGIARALYADPDILVLDEATSALDAETERQLTATLTALAGRKTLIVIAHRLATIRRADVICLMEAGRVVASGTYDELMARNESFRHAADGDRPGARPPREAALTKD
jgi:ATP-binding cassette subfamily C protein